MGRHRDVVFLIGRRRKAVDAPRVGQRLILAGQRRSRDLGNNEARIETAFGKQEGGQAAHMGIGQKGDAPLGHRPGHGERDRQHVGGQSDRLAVEIAAVKDVAGIGKDQWIVAHRVHLAPQDVDRESHGIEQGAHNLRLAA